MDKDYILQIKVRNGPLLREMRRCGFTTASALARAAKCNNTIVGQYLALALPPYDTAGRLRPSIERIAFALKVIPECLFPPQHLQKALAVSNGEVDISLNDVAGLIDSNSDPSRRLTIADNERQLSVALASLEPRRAGILRELFGVDMAERRTLDEIAADQGVTKERIRQLSIKAMRTLARQYPRLRDQLHEQAA